MCKIKNESFSADCIMFSLLLLLQVMLVDGFKGQKVQDVKKPIQKMMIDKVFFFPLFMLCSFECITALFLCTTPHCGPHV